MQIQYGMRGHADLHHMLETLLSYGEDAKKSQLTSELFYKDEAGRMDETVIVADGGHHPNSGLQKRRAFVAESREFDMIGRVHGDVVLSRTLSVERSGYEN